MAKFLGVDIAGILDGAFKAQGVGTVTFRKRVPGARTAGHNTAGTNDTFTSYTVRAIVDTHRRSYQMSLGGAPGGGPTLVQAGDKKVLIFANSLPQTSAQLPTVTPAVGDRIVAAGVEMTIYYVDIDPAGATFECSAR